MADFGRSSYPAARKRHRCEFCYGFIPHREQHFHFVGVYEGEWQDWRMHKECYEDYEMSGEYEFNPGEAPMPERVGKLMEGTHQK